MALRIRYFCPIILSFIFVDGGNVTKNDLISCPCGWHHNLVTWESEAGGLPRVWSQTSFQKETLSLTQRNGLCQIGWSFSILKDQFGSTESPQSEATLVIECHGSFAFVFLWATLCTPDWRGTHCADYWPQTRRGPTSRGLRHGLPCLPHSSCLNLIVMLLNKSPPSYHCTIQKHFCVLTSLAFFKKNCLRGGVL